MGEELQGEAYLRKVQQEEGEVVHRIDHRREEEVHNSSTGWEEEEVHRNLEVREEEVHCCSCNDQTRTKKHLDVRFDLDRTFLDPF